MNNNPIANETFAGKVKSKIKTMTGKKEQEMNADHARTINPVVAHLVGVNDAVNICANACACCWDKGIPDDFAGRAEYVARRSRTGHTSVIEHSNHVILLEIDSRMSVELVEFMSTNHYLYTATSRSNDGYTIYLLIGGSYRGYCDLYRDAKDLNNPILNAITGNLYTYSNKCFFEDICKAGLLDGNRFLNVEPDEHFKILSAPVEYNTDTIEIAGIDSIVTLAKNIADANTDAKFSTYDLIKFCTISVLFKNMSRTGTHQLVRHRNAITQESQRYVDYSKACFSSPEIFKPGKYDPEHKYAISFGPSGKLHMTLNEIGEAICGIYEKLYRPEIAGKEFALLKEDARAFLPGNVQCKKLYMTFTYKSFLKFLHLREDRAAQAEIRKYATELGDWFRGCSSIFDTAEKCYTYAKPRMSIDGELEIQIPDEVISDEVKTIPTAEDYVKAAGLDQEETVETAKVEE